MSDYDSLENDITISYGNGSNKISQQKKRT